MRRLLLFLMVLIISRFSAAAEFSGYVAVMTDYVKRGVSQSESDPALQLGGDVNFANGFYFGAWASTTDIDNGPGRYRDRELNYYLGYVFDLSESWQISANAVAYEYPGQTGYIDYSYQEYSVGGNYDDRLWLEFAYTPDLYHTGLSANNADLYAEWPLDNGWFVGGGAGYYDTSKLTGSAYKYWQLGVTKSFKWVDVDLRFHDTDESVPIISTPNRSGARVALKFQFPF